MTERAIYRQLERYQVHLGELQTPIFINLWLDIDGNQIFPQFSHRLKTPTQIDPYAPTNARQYEPGAPLDSLVSTMVTVLNTHYAEAVAAGHTPSESWLLPA